MQRQGFGGAQAHSPPLHHPVPQHVSTVPMMRSPPPQQQQDASQTNTGYGTPYNGNMQQHNHHNQNGQQFAPAFGGFMNDPTTAMGIQVGKTAMAVGQDYVDSHMRKYVSTIALKHYFNVTTSYVLKKLILVLVPWRHKPWSRQQRSTSAGQDQGSYYFLPPREDLNSPDMYIPVMAFVTYILLSTLLAGMRGVFHPEVMGSTFMYAFLVVIGEILTLRAGTYILNITNESQLLDLVAYAGYKFVGVIVTLVISETINGGKGAGGWVGWTVFLYTYMANAFFLLRSLKYVILPDSSGPAANGMMQTVAKSQRTARKQFLFVYSYVIQLVFMWILTRQDSALGKVGGT